jgi:hypothetical protein
MGFDLKHPHVAFLLKKKKEDNRIKGHKKSSTFKTLYE